MSVPPWVKWQNYLMYLEKTYDLGLNTEDDDDDDDVLDYSDHVGRYVKIISEELGQPVSSDDLSVYTAGDAGFWSQVQKAYLKPEQLWIEKMISEEMSFYLPEIDAAYLARATVNHAASLAMQFVHAKLSKRKRLFSAVPKDFVPMIWIEGVTYFGSKMINYKRKTDTIADIKLSLAAKHAEEGGREALQLALAQKMHELILISGSAKHRMQMRPRRKWSYMRAGSLLGGMLGERLFNGYQKKMVSVNTVGNFLKKPLETEHFESIYLEILEVVESLPAAFYSKQEKL
jgi:hypothetical protein